MGREDGGEKPPQINQNVRRSFVNRKYGGTIPRGHSKHLQCFDLEGEKILEGDKELLIG